MKKLLLILLIIFPLNVFASTNTCIRTDDKLNVPDKIKYKERMKNNVLSTPCVDASEKVYDFADLLTDEEENNIYNKTMNFIDKTDLDLGIVTISINNKDANHEDKAMVFADDFYDYNDFSRHGILLLIDMDTRKYYFSTTGNAIFYFSDDRVDSVLDSMEYDMVNDNYNGAVLEFIEEIESYYNEGIITDKYKIDSNGKIVRKTPFILITIISFGVALICSLILKGRNKKIKTVTHANKYVNGTLKLTKKNEIFLRQTTDKHFSPVSDYSSSGSSGGSFSSHSGSSGSSHGGGGRSF